MIMFPQLLPLLTVLSVFFEGDTSGDYSLGLDASVVTDGVWAVVSQNIIPILTLLGIMLGFYLVIRFFRRAEKAKI